MGGLFFLLVLQWILSICVKGKEILSPSKHKKEEKIIIYNYIECEDFHTFIR